MGSDHDSYYHWQHKVWPDLKSLAITCHMYTTGSSTSF